MQMTGLFYIILAVIADVIANVCLKKSNGFASKKYHPIDDLDADAWKALNMRTRYYTTRLHVGAFYLPAFLEEMLREVEEPK